MKNRKKKTWLTVVYFIIVMAFIFISREWEVTIRALAIGAMALGYHFLYKQIDKSNEQN